MPGQTAPKRTKIQRENDLALIADLYLKQWTQVAIAAHIADVRRPLGYAISQPMVSNDLKEIQKRWRAASLLDMNEAKQRELARIDVLEREYWEAWAKSQQPRKVSQSKAIQSTNRDSKEAIQRAEERTGDPRYLEGVRWCIAQRCKILGVEAPVFHDLRGELVIKVIYDGNERV